jgi:hypothetical protein
MEDVGEEAFCDFIITCLVLTPNIAHTANLFKDNCLQKIRRIFSLLAFLGRIPASYNEPPVLPETK